MLYSPIMANEAEVIRILESAKSVLLRNARGS